MNISCQAETGGVALKMNNAVLQIVESYLEVLIKSTHNSALLVRDLSMSEILLLRYTKVFGGFS